MIKISTFCKHFYASRYIPIAYFENEEEIFSTGFPEEIKPFHFILRKLIPKKTKPDVFTAPDSGIYGIVEFKSQRGYCIIGPAYGSRISDDMVRAYMNTFSVPIHKMNETKQILSSIPQYSYNRFLNLIAFLHLILNGEEISITEHFSVSKMNYEKEIAVHHTEATYRARDEQQNHGTYIFEQNMLEFVKKGNVTEMRNFLLSSVQNESLTEGKLADTPLRQAKNVFIGAVTLVGKYGGIPGGMDIEQTYSLIDTYIQECEKLRSIDAVKNLQYNMLIDFTNRVSLVKTPHGMSNEIHLCTQYISLHLNEHISIDDIAFHIKKSRSYLTTKFRKETGMTINEYITNARMEEAEKLLRHTNKPIAEISEYLCFSTQPYFSNVFKKHYGITPMEYRLAENVLSNER